MEKERKKIAVIMGDPRKTDKSKPDNKFDEDDINTINKLREALATLTDYDFIYFNDHDTLLSSLISQKNQIDFVFNLCDEGYMNDPQKESYIPALLDILGIPYSGAGEKCLIYCFNKFLVKEIAKGLGVSVADSVLIMKDEAPSIEMFPVIVKPVFGDGSYGITARSVANNSSELKKALSEIREYYSGPILIEEFLGGDDLTLGVIGNVDSFNNNSAFLLPIIKENFDCLALGMPKICGREAKWDDKSLYWKIYSTKAELPEETKKKIIDSSLILFKELECKDYARFDWRLNSQGQPKILEVNPNPGWCWDGHLAKASKILGIDYSQMLELILKEAEKRIKK